MELNDHELISHWESWKLCSFFLEYFIPLCRLGCSACVIFILFSFSFSFHPLPGFLPSALLYLPAGPASGAVFGFPKLVLLTSESRYNCATSSCKMLYPRVC